MSSDALATRFKEAEKKFLAADDVLAELARHGHATARAIDNFRTKGEPINIDAVTAPDEIRNAISKWINAKNELELAWNAIPDTFRQMMKTPDILSRRD